MTSKSKQLVRLVTLAIAIPTVLASYSVIRAMRATAASIAPMRHAITPNARADAFARVSDLRDVDLRTSDGLTLHGWFSPGSRRAAIVFVHGGAGDRLQLFPEAAVLARHGYGVLVYDSRGCGESDGDHTSWGDQERRDLTAALDFLSSRADVDPARIGVLGVSVGATSSALVAATDTRVRAVVLSPVWTSLEEELATKSGRPEVLTHGPSLSVLRREGVDVGAVRPIDHVHEIAPRAVFFITGERDTDTPVPITQRMFDAAGDPKRLWVVPGASHGKYFASAPAEWESRVVGFFDEMLR